MHIRQTGSIGTSAWRVVYVCADIGLRLVEVVNLTNVSIRLRALDGSAGRAGLENKSQRTAVPLVGVAPEVMREAAQRLPQPFRQLGGAIGSCQRIHEGARFATRPEARPLFAPA